MAAAPQWDVDMWLLRSEPEAPHGCDDASQGCLRVKLEETMVVKAPCELRGVTQLLAIGNYKPRALGRGGGGCEGSPPTSA